MPDSTAYSDLSLRMARYVLHDALPEDLPRFAAEALVAGIDSPSLRVLAGASHADTPSELHALFRAAVAELGLTFPGRVGAAYSIMRHWARRVCSGETSTFTGATAIAAIFYEVEPELPCGAKTLDDPAWQICGAHHDYALLTEADASQVRELDDYILRACILLAAP